jgi:O-antigen ligase
VFDTIFGLPVHALVLHAVVVLLPLAALGVVLMAAVPRWRPALRWPTLVLTLLSVASIPVTTQSGHALERRIGSSELIEEHRALGDTMLWFGLAMLVLTAAFVFAERARQRGAAVAVLAVLAVIASGAATVQVMRTGHAGTTAVWQPIVDATEGG